MSIIWEILQMVIHYSREKKISMIKLLFILLLSFLSCKEDYTCELTIYHVDQTHHNLPVEIRVGYETYRIEPQQTLILSVFKNVELDICINTWSDINNGHTSLISFYEGSSAGKLIIKQRVVFENVPTLCAFSLIADNNCQFKVIR